jgi:hypothetical protein
MCLLRPCERSREGIFLIYQSEIQAARLCLRGECDMKYEWLGRGERWRDEREREGTLAIISYREMAEEDVEVTVEVTVTAATIATE